MSILQGCQQWVKLQLSHINLSHFYIIVCGDERYELLNEIVLQNEIGGFSNDANSQENLRKKIKDGNYADLLLLKSSGASYKVEQMKEIIDFLKLKPYEGKRRWVGIMDGESLSISNQNKLLKSLEEPAGKATILIFVKDTSSLLDTVISRGQILRVNSKQQEDDKLNRLIDSIFDATHTYKKLKLIDENLANSKEADQFLEALEKRVLSDGKKKHISIDIMGRYYDLIEKAMENIRGNIDYKRAIKIMVLQMEEIDGKDCCHKI